MIRAQMVMRRATTTPLVDRVETPFLVDEARTPLIISGLSMTIGSVQQHPDTLIPEARTRPIMEICEKQRSRPLLEDGTKTRSLLTEAGMAQGVNRFTTSRNVAVVITFNNAA